MTAVTSNLGRGDVFVDAHLTGGSDRAEATLSAPNLTVTWMGLSPDDQRALAVAFRDLAVKLDALNVDEPIDLYPTGDVGATDLEAGPVRLATHVAVPIARWSWDGHPMVTVRAGHRNLVLEPDEYRTIDTPPRIWEES